MRLGSGGPESGESDGFADHVGVLGAAVDHLVGLDVDRMTEGELATDLVRLARQADRIQSILAAMTATAHQRGIGIADGHPSTPAWVAWRTGQSRGGVNRVIRLGELAELLPETAAAWRAGEISTAAVEMLASARAQGHDAELAACEPELLRLARARDHRSLRVATAHFAACARADGSRPRDPDGLTLAPVGDRTVVTGELSGDAAETVTHAISVFTPRPTDLPDLLPAQRRALALTRICEIALRHGTDAEGARASVSYLTHRRECDGTPGLTVGDFTGVLDPRLRDRILCDCQVSRVVMGADSRPLDVGRASQTWPPAVRRAIVARDRGCQWPGCTLPAGWCDAHHFVHWESGGATAVTNGFLLCRAHHTFLHRHPDWRVTFDDQLVRVFRRDGRELSRDPWRELLERAEPSRPSRCDDDRAPVASGA